MHLMIPNGKMRICVTCYLVLMVFGVCRCSAARHVENSPYQDDTLNGKWCPEGYERCPRTEHCILSTWICDGEDDCGDGWDEPTECATRVCDVGQVRCDSGQCVYKQLFCRGLVACSDASVRPRDVCPSTVCPYGHVLCPASERCIREVWLCDGDQDCDDNWDEHFDTCREHQCNEDQVKCNSGRCIARESFCTGHETCGDNTNIRDVCPNVTCEIGWSKCAAVEKCIRDDWACDGDADCTDGSDEDELFCAWRSCQADEVRCNSGQCVSREQFCRGSTCRDDSREAERNEICNGVKRLLDLLRRASVN